MNDYESKAFKENISTCTDRTLLNWLETELAKLEREFQGRMFVITKMRDELAKRFNVGDYQAVRKERYNPKTKRWEEVSINEKEKENGNKKD